MRYLMALVLAVILAVPAQARWLQAESEHFVIYAEDSESDLQHFAELLERFHASMELLTGLELASPSPSSRVTVFVLSGERDVKRLYGDRNANIAGFYTSRAGMSRAFVPRLQRTRNEPDFSQTVLLHEYAHHFFASTSPYAMPRWMSEGAAEFFASAKLNRDGTLQVGRAAQHRAVELLRMKKVPIRELLDYELYLQNKSKSYDSFYGRSWLLIHYLWFTESRKGQLNAYRSALNRGADPLAAAEQIFGDLDQLDEDLDDYVRQRKLMSYSLPPKMIPIGPVTVSAVSDGMDRMLPVIAHSQSGVTSEEAQEVLRDARKVAAQYPDDARVLAALAEAEFDAGYNAQAIAAADRALAIDATVKNAYVQKGYAMFRLAADSEDDDSLAAYKAAMAPFLQLNKLENDHPLPLIYVYRSYTDRGAEPSERAKLALLRASQLAPFDQDLAFNTAVMLAQSGQIAHARQMFGAVAADPHGGGRATRAAAMAERLQTAKEGTPVTMTDLMVDRVVETAAAE